MTLFNLPHDCYICKACGSIHYYLDQTTILYMPHNGLYYEFPPVEEKCGDEQMRHDFTVFMGL